MISQPFYPGNSVEDELLGELLVGRFAGVYPLLLGLALYVHKDLRAFLALVDADAVDPVEKRRNEPEIRVGLVVLGEEVFERTRQCAFIRYSEHLGDLLVCWGRRRVAWLIPIAGSVASTLGHIGVEPAAECQEGVLVEVLRLS